MNLFSKSSSPELKNKTIVLIYNNPVHSEVIDNMGYEKVYIKESWHPAGSYIIYKSKDFL